jgi:beta-galactosidase beta subunit
MIAGTKKELKEYQFLIPALLHVCQYLDDNTLPKFGEWQNVTDSLRVIRLNDWNRDNIYFENHTLHHDLHYTLKGVDLMRICLKAEGLTTHLPYDSEKDFALYEANEEIRMRILKDNWVLIHAHEPHRNEFLEEGTEKLVFKIKA